MTASSGEFLNVPRLLQASEPRPRLGLQWYFIAMIAMVVLLTSWAASTQSNATHQQAVRLAGGLTMLVLVVAMGMVTNRMVRNQRREQQRLEAIEELVQLRRWDQAAVMLDNALSQPARTQAARLQTLIYLASVLARYHRFGDAIAVQDYLLQQADYDPATAHGIKLMRTMAMLHEDHLFDADRAISELRRESPESAGLALVEIYRDVKTGHPAEAISLFTAKLPEMRNQLGHRVADAYALVARAHDLLDQPYEAGVAFERATLLAPLDELCRRYPEVAAIREKYVASPVPKELA